MKLSITVKPNAKKQGVKKRPDGSYRVSVKSPPVKGKANEEIIEVLAEYFSLPKKSIRITHGLSNKKKWVEVER